LLSITIAGTGGEALSVNSLQITVDLLGEDDTSLEQKTLQAAASDGSNTNLRSTASLSLEGAKSLVVNVSHPGYTSYSRRIAAEEVVYLNAELQAVEEVTVSMTQTASISGAMVDGFTLSLTASGTEGDIQIGIPRSLLPEGTTSVTAELKSFDPNDPSDAQNFPGEYADTDGNNLVSVAFDYANIRTAEGQSLTALAKARTASQTDGVSVFSTAAAEPVIINRDIPASSCVTLTRLGDADAESAGFQIPVYSFDSNRGLWELLGYGTVYTAFGALIDTVDETECEANPYVLEIAVSSDIFLSQWWNLDYPLIFSQPVKYCAKVQLQNDAGLSLKGIHGFHYGATATFASEYFVTDDSGMALLEVEAADAGDTLTTHIAVFGEANYYGEAVLGKDCMSPQAQILQVNLPRLCQIRGTLEYPDGTPATRYPVLAVPEVYALGDYIDFSASGPSGEYWLNASCDKDYLVTVYGSEDETNVLVNVDGNAAANEKSDNGDVAELNTVIATPIPTNLYSSAYSTVDKRILLFILAHRDNFPMTYNLSVENAAGQQIGSLTGNAQLSMEDDEDYLWYFGFSEVVADVDIDVLGGTTVTLKGFLTDSLDRNTVVDTAVYVIDEPLSSISE
jgi:hypothetical protein